MLEVTGGELLRSTTPSARPGIQCFDMIEGTESKRNEVNESGPGPDCEIDFHLLRTKVLLFLVAPKARSSDNLLCVWISRK